jgi:glycosyltransferase involved in cell wall biosynthesis
MRTILATSFTPTIDSGRARRTYGVVAALAHHGPLDLVYGAFGADEIDPAYLTLPEISFHRVSRPGRLQRLPSYLRARRSGVPSDFARGIWAGIPARVAELSRDAGPGSLRVVAEGPVVAASLLPLVADLPAAYCAHNLESSFRHRLDETQMSERALQRFERLLLESYEESWMVSEADMEGARALAPGAGLRLVPNVVDVAAIEPIAPRFGQRSLLFVADLTYEPNRDALQFLTDSVLPELWQRDLGVKLVLVGKGSADVRPADPRIEPQGFVPDLREVYDGAGCVVVPLREGGGSPLKFVEALAFGAPIVATPLAAAGLEVIAGEHYLEAEADGASFAAAVLEALDPASGNRLGTAARQLAERLYSIEALEQRLGL